jgi:uncharacterized protein
MKRLLPYRLQQLCGTLLSLVWLKYGGALNGAGFQGSQMRINVSQISEDEGLKIRHLFPEREPSLRSKETQIIGRPALSAYATRKGSQVRLTGKLSSTVQIDCARCLAPVPISVEEGFDLFYIPSFDPTALKEEKELGEEDLMVAFYQGDQIDLDDLVREQIELALPMARLCASDCRGLCPECGANLNEGQCACGPEYADPRWAVLDQLKDDFRRSN